MDPVSFFITVVTSGAGIYKLAQLLAIWHRSKDPDTAQGAATLLLAARGKAHPALYARSEGAR